jgi:hypothetical protein
MCARTPADRFAPCRALIFPLGAARSVGVAGPGDGPVLIGADFRACTLRAEIALEVGRSEVIRVTGANTGRAGLQVTLSARSRTGL